MLTNATVLFALCAALCFIAAPITCAIFGAYVGATIIASGFGLCVVARLFKE